MKSILLILPAVLCLAGCSPVGGQLKQWHGARLDELIAQAGPPSSVSTDPSGVKQFHWLEDRGGVYTYIGPVNLKCERIFGVDDQEVITSIDWNGNCLALPDSPWQRRPQGLEGAE